MDEWREQVLTGPWIDPNWEKEDCWASGLVTLEDGWRVTGIDMPEGPADRFRRSIEGFLASRPRPESSNGRPNSVVELEYFDSASLAIIRLRVEQKPDGRRLYFREEPTHLELAFFDPGTQVREVGSSLNPRIPFARERTPSDLDLAGPGLDCRDSSGRSTRSALVRYVRTEDGYRARLRWRVMGLKDRWRSFIAEALNRTPPRTLGMALGEGEVADFHLKFFDHGEDEDLVLEGISDSLQWADLPNEIRFSWDPDSGPPDVRDWVGVGGQPGTPPLAPEVPVAGSFVLDANGSPDRALFKNRDLSYPIGFLLIVTEGSGLPGRIGTRTAVFGPSFEVQSLDREEANRLLDAVDLSLGTEESAWLLRSQLTWTSLPSLPERISLQNILFLEFEKRLGHADSRGYFIPVRDTDAPFLSIRIPYRGPGGSMVQLSPHPERSPGNETGDTASGPGARLFIDPLKTDSWVAERSEGGEIEHSLFLGPAGGAIWWTVPQNSSPLGMLRKGATGDATAAPLTLLVLDGSEDPVGSWGALGVENGDEVVRDPREEAHLILEERKEGEADEDLQGRIKAVHLPFLDTITGKGEVGLYLRGLVAQVKFGFIGCIDPETWQTRPFFCMTFLSPLPISGKTHEFAWRSILPVAVDSGASGDFRFSSGILRSHLTLAPELIDPTMRNGGQLPQLILRNFPGCFVFRSREGLALEKALRSDAGDMDQFFDAVPVEEGQGLERLELGDPPEWWLIRGSGENSVPHSVILERSAAGFAIAGLVARDPAATEVHLGWIHQPGAQGKAPLRCPVLAGAPKDRPAYIPLDAGRPYEENSPGQSVDLEALRPILARWIAGSRRELPPSEVQGMGIRMVQGDRGSGVCLERLKEGKGSESIRLPSVRVFASRSASCELRGPG